MLQMFALDISSTMKMLYVYIDTLQTQNDHKETNYFTKTHKWTTKRNKIMRKKKKINH